ncbi:MAG: outer membrane protein assembly factor BamE [Magnetococcales bacterium]|nr:outer membrane protein assembly factor BamE [Magnetococcales bacterium]
MIGPLRRISFSLALSLAVVLNLVLASCQTMVQEQGNILDPQKVAQLREGRSTRKEVLDLLGSPTIVNSFKPNRWIYLQDSRFDKFQAVNRLEVEFDQRGVVRYITRNFSDEVWNAQQLSAPEQNRSFRYFRNLMENDVRDLTPNAPTSRRVPLVAAAPVPERASQKPGFFQRLFSRWKSQPARPETPLAPEEPGWWRGIWPSDPTDPSRKSPTSTQGSDNNSQTPFPFPLPQ